MALKKNAPGCGSAGGCSCEDECVFFSDNFDRADSASLGSNWVERAGAWNIASNKLVTSSAGAKAQCVNTAGDGTGADAKWRDTIVRATNAGDKVRIQGNVGTGANANGDTFEVEFASGAGNGMARIGRVTTGVFTVLHECPVTAEPGVDYSIRLDHYLGHDSGQICWHGWWDGVRVVGMGTTSATSGYTTGLGTGDTVTGPIYFDDFRWGHLYKASAPNAHPTCIRSANFPWPIDVDESEQEQVQVVVAGLSSAGFGAGICSNLECAALNGTYVLTRVSSCVWELPLNLTCALDPVTLARLTISSPGTGYGIRFNFNLRRESLPASSINFEFTWANGGSPALRPGGCGGGHANSVTVIPIRTAAEDGGCDTSHPTATATITTV